MWLLLNTWQRSASDAFQCSLDGLLDTLLTPSLSAAGPEPQHSMKQDNPLLSLPDEIWTNILGQLCNRDVLVLERTSPAIRLRQQKLYTCLLARVDIIHAQFSQLSGRKLASIAGLVRQAHARAANGRVRRPDYLAVRRALGSLHVLDKKAVRKCQERARPCRPYMSAEQLQSFSAMGKGHSSHRQEIRQSMQSMWERGIFPTFLF